MRETKDQKIIRLERKIEKLENYIKELKAGSRQLKKDVKLGMNIKETSHKSDIANLNKEMNRLISENSRLQKSITDLEEEKKGLIIRLKNSNKSKEEIRFEESCNNLKQMSNEDNVKRLEDWNMGFAKDKYGLTFIDPTMLTLNINPNTGARLKPFSCIHIAKSIENNPLYIKKCDELYELKERVFRECEIEEFINNVGRELYEKLYKDFPFEDYEMS